MKKVLKVLLHRKETGPRQTDSIARACHSNLYLFTISNKVFTKYQVSCGQTPCLSTIINKAENDDDPREGNPIQRDTLKADKRIHCPSKSLRIWTENSELPSEKFTRTLVNRIDY